MNLFLKPLVATAAVAAVALVGAPAEASAKPVNVHVTITGNDGPDGVVKSPKRVCKANVLVTVYRQIGTRGGGDDERVGSDTTSAQGNAWGWSIGNPGLEDGDVVYATVKPHGPCKRTFSPAMTVDKSDD